MGSEKWNHDRQTDQATERLPHREVSQPTNQENFVMRDHAASVTDRNDGT